MDSETYRRLQIDAVTGHSGATEFQVQLITSLIHVQSMFSSKSEIMMYAGLSMDPERSAHHKVPEYLRLDSFCFRIYNHPYPTSIVAYFPREIAKYLHGLVLNSSPLQ